MNYIDQIKLDRADLDAIHDVILHSIDDLYVNDVTDEDVLELWRLLDESIKYDVIKYGGSDTPTRDNIYQWIIDNNWKP